MEKIKKVINSPLFRTGVCAAVGVALVVESHPLYAGIALGVAAREFFLAFKA
tara:strand:+ start:353 stop:508 length:156 start_codon:yes stop_codon:yes gene_type:complete